jgi:hypothetical protein
VSKTGLQTAPADLAAHAGRILKLRHRQSIRGGVTRGETGDCPLGSVQCVGRRPRRSASRRDGPFSAVAVDSGHNYVPPGGRRGGSARRWAVGGPRRCAPRCTAAPPLHRRTAAPPHRRTAPRRAALRRAVPAALMSAPTPTPSSLLHPPPRPHESSLQAQAGRAAGADPRAVCELDGADVRRRRARRGDACGVLRRVSAGRRLRGLEPVRGRRRLRRRGRVRGARRGAAAARAGRPLPCDVVWQQRERRLRVRRGRTVAQGPVHAAGRRRGARRARGRHRCAGGRAGARRAGCGAGTAAWRELGSAPSAAVTSAQLSPRLCSTPPHPLPSPPFPPGLQTARAGCRRL